jgi:hypothetical protein
LGVAAARWAANNPAVRPNHPVTSAGDFLELVRQRTHCLLDLTHDLSAEVHVVLDSGKLLAALAGRATHSEPDDWRPQSVSHQTVARLLVWIDPMSVPVVAHRGRLAARKQ